ncbi:hypothetical protein [Nonomuraea sp. NPDC049158]|uniref:hypothetical protein n=1 Tax=Nonomuraea sp. NPDC049158 TaxID=3155649 RepID=UPI0033F98ABA
MADEPAKPRRLTVYAEVAAVLALVVAIVGVVVALFAFEHDKEVADGGQGATPVVTVTQYSPNVGSQESAEPDSSSGFWGTAGVVALTIITGLISSFLVFKSWEELVISDVIVVLITAAIAGMHTFILSLMGITLVWAIVLAVIFAVIGFFANVFAA